MRYTLSIIAAMLCVQPAVAQGWKRDLETHYQSDEFMAGAELDRALDGLYVQLKALLTELELAKPAK